MTKLNNLVIDALVNKDFSILREINFEDINTIEIIKLQQLNQPLQFIKHVPCNEHYLKAQLYKLLEKIKHRGDVHTVLNLIKNMRKDNREKISDYRFISNFIEATTMNFSDSINHEVNKVVDIYLKKQDDQNVL